MTPKEDTLVISFTPGTKNGDLSCVVVCRQQPDALVIINEFLGEDADYIYQLLQHGTE